MARRVEVVALIFRSAEYLESIHKEIQRYLPPDVTWRIVGNDPAERVLLAAKQLGIPLDLYHDKDPGDFYLSRVYRAWNYCVESSKADYVCLVNSDMMFSPGWLEALIREREDQIPCSRLVERAHYLHMDAGKHAIQADFGGHPLTFSHEMWLGFVEKAKNGGKSLPGGCYMPCLMPRKEFMLAGGYPEGNVVIDKGAAIPVKPNPQRLDFRPDGPYHNGLPFLSGDDYLFRKLDAMGMKHVTVTDSIVYHVQEGEMRS